VHHLWFVDGAYLHLASGAPDFKPRNPKDDQFYRIIDVRQPTRPVEVGRWWLPGTRDGDAEPAPARHPKFDAGFRAHNQVTFAIRRGRFTFWLSEDATPGSNSVSTLHFLYMSNAPDVVVGLSFTQPL